MRSSVGGAFDWVDEGGVEEVERLDLLWVGLVIVERLERVEHHWRGNAAGPCYGWLSSPGERGSVATEGHCHLADPISAVVFGV
jgi:hypothetical protein